MSRCKACAKREEEAREARKAALRAEFRAGRAPSALTEREEILDDAIRALKPLWPETIRHIREYGVEVENLNPLFPAFVAEICAEFRRRTEHRAGGFASGAAP